MTYKERRNPKLLNGSRRIRIANGSGTSVQQINKFMETFEVTQKMMKQMKTDKGMKNMMKNANSLFIKMWIGNDPKRLEIIHDLNNEFKIDKNNGSKTLR